MRVVYRWERKVWGDGSVAQRPEAHIVVEEPCCAEMSEAWRSGAIRFGDFNDYGTYEPAVNFSYCHAYPEGAVWDEYPIKFCPFCGQPIRLVEESKEPVFTGFPDRRFKYDG